MQTEVAAQPTPTLPTPALPTWRQSSPDRPLGGMTILVVEDSRFASEAVRLLCLRSGARIRRADCLRSAARHLQTYRPAVVIVDLGLPDGDGAGLIRQIASSGPGAPVVLGLSGDPDAKAAAMAAGASGFLAKPIESLAMFQRMILAALPPEVAFSSAGRGPRLPSTEVICPDQASLHDDLAHVAAILSQADDTTAVDYLARFLAGVARSSHDKALEHAATDLARNSGNGSALAHELARISSMVHDRLSGRPGV